MAAARREPDAGPDGHRKWELVIILTASLAGSALAGFLFLYYCDPGNNRFIYLFQMRLRGHVKRDFGNPWNGEVRSWWLNGQLQSLETFDNGTPNGRWAKWKPDGSVTVDGEYRARRPWKGTFHLPEDIPGGKPCRLVVVSFEEGTPVRALLAGRRPFTGTVREQRYENRRYDFKNGAFVGRKGEFWLPGTGSGGGEGGEIAVTFEGGAPARAATWDGKPFTGTVREVYRPYAQHEFKGGVVVGRSERGAASGAADAPAAGYRPQAAGSRARVGHER